MTALGAVTPADGREAMRLDGCLECGAGFQRRREHGAFCSPRCRGTFNNRRARRGAELYDLYMAHRYERPLARALGLFQAINRLASVYRAEDLSQRDGRASWRRPQEVMAERPFLKAIATATRAGR
ncbi:transcriptional regulator [Jiella sp. CBK1P-4]|uniref:Transcriptional regulator n=2 Tax=Jiella avicenniae TaxID=2907202 RepID=A0A9X1NX63_9HYPH|nr:transcriptional regulator [Jiella avicenniae]